MPRVWKFRDDVTTDAIIPGRLNVTTDPVVLASHCFHDAKPEFRNDVREGDLIIAGENFGMGSSREHAPIAIKAAGCRAVIASSFARIFFRNGINIGLPLFILKGIADQVEDGEDVEYDKTNWRLILLKKRAIRLPALDPHVEKIILAGGVIKLLNQNNLKVPF